MPIDGVLVDVQTGLRLILVHYLRMSPFETWPVTQPPHTIRRLCQSAGLTEPQIRVVRNIVRSFPDWYLRLSPVAGMDEYLPEIKRELHAGRMALYVRRLSTRGRSNEEQVKLWLKRHTKIKDAMLLARKEN